MKTYFSLFFFALISLQVIAQKNGEEPYLTKSLTDAAIKSIEAQTSGGNISVEGVNSGARIEVYIRNNNGNTVSKQEIEEKLQNYDLTIDAGNGKLTAIAKNKSNKWDWKKALSISFKIYAPKSVTSKLSTSGGNIALTNLEGDQKFRTSGGNLIIDAVTGDIDGGTSGGNIDISNAKATVALSTSGGNIDASDCNGKMDMSTSGGNIRLSHLQGNVTASTSGGNIHGDEIEGSLSARTSGGNVDVNNMSGSLETATSGGSMHVNVIKLGDFVHVSNSGGNIDLQLPKGQGLNLYMVGDKIKTNSLTNFSGSVGDNKVDGKINGGGTEVIVKNSGRINLSLQ